MGKRARNGKKSKATKSFKKDKKGLDASLRKCELEDVKMEDKVIHMPSFPSSSSPSSAKKENEKKEKKEKKEEKEEKEKKKDGAKKHSEELNDLATKDPEFYNFLKENDAGLLNFEDEEDDDLDDMMEDYSDDDQDEGQPKRTIEVTSSVLKKLTKGIEQSDNFNTLRKLLSIFRTACMPLTGDEDEDARRSSSSFVIKSPEIYEEAMTVVLKASHHIYYNTLKLPRRPTKQDTGNISEHPKYKKMQPAIISFFKSILHTLSNLIDTVKQDQVSIYILSALEPYIPLLSPLPRLTKGVLKILLSIWSTGSQIGEDFDLRGHAFLRIRQMTLVLPDVATEECFKGIYLTYARYCKSFNEQNSNTIFYMVQCIAELYKTDVSHGYQQAFLYIRQLALHLRGAIVRKDEEAMKQVVTWQYLNCLRLWTRVVCTLPKKEELGDLAFPLTQVMNGVILKAQSNLFIPLRCHLINCMQQLAAYSRAFIPTALRILEMWEKGDLLSKPSPSTDAPPKLQYMIKLPADSIKKPSVKDAIVHQIVSLIRQDTEIYRYNVGLPEYLHRTIRFLRSFIKKCRNSKWKDLIRALISHLENYSTKMITERNLLNKAPLEVTGFEPMLEKFGDKPAAARLTALMAMNQSGAVSIINPDAKVDLSKRGDKDDDDNSSIDSEEIGGVENEANETARSSLKSKKKKSKEEKKKNDIEFDDEETEDKVTEGLNWSDDEDEKDDDDDDDEEEEEEEEEDNSDQPSGDDVEEEEEAGEDEDDDDEEGDHEDNSDQPSGDDVEVSEDDSD